LHETAEWAGEHHTQHVTSLPTPREIIHQGLWADWKSPIEKLKNINSELQSNTDSGGGGGTLNLTQRMGVDQGAKLSALNSQWANMYAKQQRLKAGSGWQANLPEEPLTPSRDCKKHKSWERGWGNRPTPKSRAGDGSWSWTLGQRAAFKTELPHLAGVVADQTELQLKGNAVAAWWKQQLWPLCSDHSAWAGSLTSPHNSN
jgi:hypothetical protein